MFKAIQQFEQVSDDTILWRYMHLNRLESLLDTSSIFFAKVTTYYDDDPFEGNYNKISEDNYKKWMLTDLPSETLETIGEIEKEKVLNHLETSLYIAKKERERVLVNCWHINNYESVAMWKLYSNYENGITIRTTFGKLKESFKDYKPNIYGGKIRYIDIKKDRISFGNTFEPFAVKRISFFHENELRLLIRVEDNVNWSTEKFANGILVNCDLNLLIESICLSPKCSDDFKSRVQEMIDEKGLEVKVNKSDLNDIY